MVDGLLVISVDDHHYITLSWHCRIWALVWSLQVESRTATLAHVIYSSAKGPINRNSVAGTAAYGAKIGEQKQTSVGVHFWRLLGPGLLTTRLCVTRKFIADALHVCIS
jgi:hypothetical protein